MCESCRLVCQRYKQELDLAKKSKKIKPKGKNKADQIEKMRNQNFDMQISTELLRVVMEQETLTSEVNQDFGNLVKAASFVSSLKEKNGTLQLLEVNQKKLEEEHKKH